jgi:uncharacterized membrane protein YhaH (DUF805 family)
LATVQRVLAGIVIVIACLIPIIPAVLLLTRQGREIGFEKVMALIFLVPTVNLIFGLVVAYRPIRVILFGKTYPPPGGVYAQRPPAAS